MSTRDEKIAAAMKKLGDKHLLHKSHQVHRRERRVDPTATDVRRTFDRVSPGWRDHESKPNSVIHLKVRK